MAAILHDTIEDTKTAPDELGALFGEKVMRLVMEVTDDKTLPNKIRKQMQVRTAPNKSDKAKMLKICDKITNMDDILNHPPVFWSRRRKKEYFDWAMQVFEGLKGVNNQLDKLFIQKCAEGIKKFKSNLI